MAYYLSSRGFEVRWWISDAEDAGTIADLGAVEATGAFTGTAPLERVSDDVASVLDGAKLVFVVVPASAHDAVAEKIAPHLQGDETIVLNPGRTGGAVCFRRSLSRFGSFPDLTVGETQSLIFTCRKVAPGVVDFLKFKDFGQCAFLGEVRESVETFFASVFPQIQIERSTLLTGLANIGAMLHPAPVLFNIGRIEDASASYLHYYEGITPTVAKFIEKMDAERLGLAERFGVEVSSISRWHELCYGIRGESLVETIRLNERYASLEAFASLDHRYLYEDIPTGLVPMIALAESVGHDVPCMRVVLKLADLVLSRDFARSGRNAASLGIEARHSVEEIQRLFGGFG
jgi:opine dehydrogenase